MRGQTDTTVAIVGIVAALLGGLVASAITAWFAELRQRRQQAHERDVKALELREARRLKDVEELRKTIDESLACANEARDALERYTPSAGQRQVDQAADKVLLLSSRLVVRLGDGHEVTQRFGAIRNALGDVLELLQANEHDFADVSPGELNAEYEKLRQHVIEAVGLYALAAQQWVGSELVADAAIAAPAMSVAESDCRAPVAWTLGAAVAASSLISLLIIADGGGPCPAACGRAESALLGALLVASVSALPLAVAAHDRDARRARQRLLGTASLAAATLLAMWAAFDATRAAFPSEDSVRALVVVSMVVAGVLGWVSTAAAAAAALRAGDHDAGRSAGIFVVVGDPVIGAALAAAALLLGNGHPGGPVVVVVYAAVGGALLALGMSVTAFTATSAPSTTSWARAAHAAVATVAALATALIWLL